MTEPSNSVVPPQVHAKLAPRFASDDDMRTWLASEAISGFAGLTGQDLIASGRADQLIAFIVAVDAGVFS